MKILTTTFFSDFARYFMYLEDEIVKLKPGSSFFNVSIYPCAHHYWRKHSRHSTLLPYRDLVSLRSTRRIPITGKYKGIELDKVVSFNRRAQNMYGLDLEKDLKVQAIRYIDYFDELFKKKCFDLYLSSGDTRMLIEITAAMAKRYGVKTYYFEQGPFGTTIFDSKGVNANSSFCDRTSFDEPIDRARLQLFLEKWRLGKRSKYWQVEKRTFCDRVWQLLTFLSMHPPKLLSHIVPTDLKIGLGFKEAVRPIVERRLAKRSSVTSAPVSVISREGRYIALLLQIPVDAQLIDNSPLYRDFVEIVKDVLDALPTGYTLVVREHPLYKGLYDPQIYELIEGSPHAIIDNATPLSTLLEEASLVVLNNSTAGLDALTYFKTVLTLGKAYYNRDGVVYNLRSRGELPSLMKYALEYPISKTNIEVFLFNLIFKYLIPGHFQDEILDNSTQVLMDIGLTNDMLS